MMIIIIQFCLEMSNSRHTEAVEMFSMLCRKGLYHDSPEMMQLHRSLMHDIGPPALHDVRSPAVAAHPPPAHRSPGRHGALVTRPPPAHFHPLPVYSPS